MLEMSDVEERAAKKKAYMKIYGKEYRKSFNGKQSVKKYRQEEFKNKE